MGIGANIKHIRESKGMSLSELSVLAGVSKSYLSSLERNLKENPSVMILERIAVVLNEDLITIIEDDMESHLEAEWIDLMQEAKRSGMQPGEVRELFNYMAWKEEQSKGTGK